MSKIVLAQINTVAGDIKNNTQKIADCIKNAVAQNADLIVFPEFALCGYPLGDIHLRHTSIIKKQNEAIVELAKLTNDKTMAVVGCVDENGKSYFSCIDDGEEFCKLTKDDNAIFSVGEETFTLNPENDYDASTIIIPACNESRTGCEYKRNKYLSELAKEKCANVIYINKIGYGDNKVYDGSSRIYNSNGELTLRAKTFEEDIVIAKDYKGNIEPLPTGMEKEVDINNFNLDYTNDLERTYNSVVLAIREYFSKNGFKKAVLGLSGGLDSTISVVLLVDALGKENVYGVSLPSRITSKESKDDARILAESLGICFFELPLAESLDATKNLFDVAFSQVSAEKCEKSTTIENLQARTRATILWSIANEHKQMLPIATSDKSEAYIGYATVNGDMSGGFAPLTDITKTKLFALGHFMNEFREKKNVIPQSILEKPPGAELKINPKTGRTVCAEEDNMPYPFLDEIIWYVENHGYGFDELMNHKFYYEKNNELSVEQKKEWINKFFWKQHCAVFKWHIIPPAVITDIHSINSAEYRQPIISKVF